MRLRGAGGSVDDNRVFNTKSSDLIVHKYLFFITEKRKANCNKCILNCCRFCCISFY